MKYSNVYIDAIGYEIAPVVVSSLELERRLEPLYSALHLGEGQLEASSVEAGQLEVLIYGGVCREYFEPATACRVASLIGVSPEAAVYDVSNACLGVLNGLVDIANRIEVGQVRAGMVVACETAREINEIVIAQLLADRSMDFFKLSLATLTGGSGAVALVLSDGSFSQTKGHRVLGGVTRNASAFHGLCRWGIEESGPAGGYQFQQFTSTDASAVLTHGIELGVQTWRAFLEKLAWTAAQVDKVICHQVGSAHRDTILKALEIPESKDFATYPFLGNTGTVALPITAALADGREFLERGDRVGFLGIGSGLNCLMLGVEW